MGKKKFFCEHFLPRIRMSSVVSEVHSDVGIINPHIRSIRQGREKQLRTCFQVSEHGQQPEQQPSWQSSLRSPYSPRGVMNWNRFP